MTLKRVGRRVEDAAEAMQGSGEGQWKGHVGKSLGSMAAGLLIMSGQSIPWTHAGIPAPGIPYEVYEGIALQDLGPRRLGADGKIVGGLVATKVKARNTQTGEVLDVVRSGTTLNNRVILTAAHCVRSQTPEIVKVESVHVSWNTSIP